MLHTHCNQHFVKEAALAASFTSLLFCMQIEHALETYISAYKKQHGEIILPDISQSQE